MYLFSASFLKLQRSEVGLFSGMQPLPKASLPIACHFEPGGGNAFSSEARAYKNLRSNKWHSGGVMGRNQSGLRYPYALREPGRRARLDASLPMGHFLNKFTNLRGEKAKGKLACPARVEFKDEANQFPRRHPARDDTLWKKMFFQNYKSLNK